MVVSENVSGVFFLDFDELDLLRTHKLLVEPFIDPFFAFTHFKLLPTDCARRFLSICNLRFDPLVEALGVQDMERTAAEHGDLAGFGELDHADGAFLDTFEPK